MFCVPISNTGGNFLNHKNILSKLRGDLSDSRLRGDLNLRGDLKFEGGPKTPLHAMD